MGVGAEGGVGVLPMTPPLGILTLSTDRFESAVSDRWRPFRGYPFPLSFRNTVNPLGSVAEPFNVLELDE